MVSWLLLGSAPWLALISDWCGLGHMTVALPQVPCCMARLSRAQYIWGIHRTYLLRM